MRALDPNAAAIYVRTLDQQVDAALINERLLAALSMAFGALALLLSTVGLYGVMTYGVARRARETAIRLALGATRGLVLGRVLREAVMVSVAGVAVGLSVTFLATRTIAAFLFELSPNDPATLIFVAAILIGTAVLAGLVPAWRAAATDPAQTLRTD